MILAMLLAIAPPDCGGQCVEVADAVETAPVSNVVSVQLAAFLATGVDVQLERYLPDPRWSLAVSLGVRPLVQHDFRGVTLSTGFEARRFVWSPILSQVEGVTRGGLFVFGRLDASYSQLNRLDSQVVGRGLRVSPSLGVGYRFIPVWRIELTPSFGGALDTQLDFGGSTALVRPTCTFGLTVGLIL